MKMSSSLDFQILPNPNDGSRFDLSVIGQIGIVKAAWIQISDMTGQEVLSTQTGLLESRMTVQIEGDLSPGLYLVSVTVEGNRVSKRMIVE